jgi:surface carbohydrate biosynthesis protein (TIGR04326 family)
MAASTLALVHEHAGTADRAIRILGHGSGPIRLLVLPGGGPRGSVARALTEAFPGRVTEIDPRPYVEDVASATRRELIRFVAEWPDRPIDRRPFKTRFVYEGLSLWWLTALAEKNNEDRPTFDLLCDIELVRKVLDAEETSPAGEAVIVTHSIDFYAVCRRLLQSRRVRVARLKPRRAPKHESTIELLTLRLRRFWSWSARAAIARQLRARSRRSFDAPDVAFYTWYPSQWVTRDGETTDRYYVDLPDYLRTRHHLRVMYAATCNEAPIREHAGVLRAFGRDAPGLEHVDLLESYLRIGDVLKAYWGSLMAVRYLWLERTSRSFRASFVWNGVDVFELLRRDLRVSFLARIPDHLLVAKQVERFCRARNPRVLVTYLELYCHGRAVIHGAKRGNPGVITVGYQHSAITRNKIFYTFKSGELAKAGAVRPDFVANLPAPDRFAVTGSAGARVLVSGGYPVERLWTVGSPRFDGLARIASPAREASPHRLDLGIDPDRVMVLVTGNMFPESTRHLIDESLSALASRPACVAVFKLHPFNRRDAEAWIRRSAAERGYTSFVISDTDVHALLDIADVLISTNSTTSGEAIAAGVPVINFRAGYLDLSPLVEGEDGVAIEARDYQEIVSALDAIGTRTGSVDRVASDRRAVFVKDMFGVLDGGARERFAARVLAELGGVQA